MSILTGLVCSRCDDVFFMYRPTPQDRDEPVCLRCAVGSLCQFPNFNNKQEKEA